MYKYRLKKQVAALFWMVPVLTVPLVALHTTPTTLILWMESALIALVANSITFEFKDKID